jgi:hypothetical protein
MFEGPRHRPAGSHRLAGEKARGPPAGLGGPLGHPTDEKLVIGPGEID